MAKRVKKSRLPLPEGVRKAVGAPARLEGALKEPDNLASAGVGTLRRMRKRKGG